MVQGSLGQSSRKMTRFTACLNNGDINFINNLGLKKPLIEFQKFKKKAHINNVWPLNIHGLFHLII